MEMRERKPGETTMEGGLWQEPLFFGVPWEMAVLVFFLAVTIFYWSELTAANVVIGVGVSLVIQRSAAWLAAGDPFYMAVYLRGEGPGGYLPVYRCFSDATVEVRAR